MNDCEFEKLMKMPGDWEEPKGMVVGDDDTLPSEGNPMAWTTDKPGPIYPTYKGTGVING